MKVCLGPFQMLGNSALTQYQNSFNVFFMILSQELKQQFLKSSSLNKSMTWFVSLKQENIGSIFCNPTMMLCKRRMT